MFRIVSAALVLLASAQAAEKPWLRAASPHFELLTDDDERKARDAVLFFESVREFFTRLDASWRPGAPVRIVAFRSRSGYKPYSLGGGATAYYAPGYSRDTIVMSAITRDAWPVAAHEYTHLVLRPMSEALPRWLSEGLAELYSTVKPMGSKVEYGHLIPARFRQLVTASWLDPATFFSAGESSDLWTDRVRGSMFYAQSWGLVHMLALSDRYAPRFKDLVREFAAGSPAGEVWQRVYGKPQGEIWKGLQSYVRAGPFNAGRLDIRLEPGAAQPAIAAADPVEVRLALAHLLAATGRYGDADRSFDELARELPQRPEVEEGRAYVDLRSDRSEEARRHLRRAVELGSRSVQLYLDLAALDQLAGKPALPVLKKAFELAPEEPEVRYRLGAVLASAGEYSAAVKYLLGIKHPDAARAFDVFHTVGYCHYRLGDSGAARDAAVEAQKRARTEAQRRRAAELLDVVK